MNSYISEKEAKEIFRLETKFIKSYAKYRDSMNLSDWLQFELRNNLPEKSSEEIVNISNEILDTIELNEKNKALLKEAINNGRSKESWFASSIKESLSYMNIKEFGDNLTQLDNVIQSNNKAMMDAIITKSGEINRNPNLDGFIAEQHHVNSFNRNAALKGSEYRAEALVPKEGQIYGKNSVDIVIKNGNGKIVRKYQAKFCKDSKATSEAFEHGDYRGQRKLVPEGQNIENSSTYIESPDGKVRSESFSKDDAKNIQKEVQENNKPIIEDWNSFNTKQLAVKIGKETGQAALYGAAIGTGIHIAQKSVQGEKIEAEEVVEVALKTGMDAGVKAALTGAIKVGSEKGIIKMIPKGTPTHTITNMVHIGVENAKIAKKVFDGELTVKEAMDEIEVNTVSMVAGAISAAKGTSIGAGVGTGVGALIGSVGGPVGTVIGGKIGAVVGGFVGGTVGYMAGSEVAKAVTKGQQKIREVVKEKAISIANSVKESAGRVLSSVTSGVRSLLSW